MKKILFVILALVFAMPAYSQWVTKRVDNKIDLPYKIAYCTSSSQRGLLKMENVDGELSIYVTGSYFCDESPIVEIAFVIGSESKRYSITGNKSSDSRTVFLVDNLLSEENTEMLSDFKKCSQVVIRVNEIHCTSEMYRFTMTGSTAAVQFMSAD